MNGIALLAEARNRALWLPVFLSYGYADRDAGHRQGRYGRFSGNACKPPYNRGWRGYAPSS